MFESYPNFSYFWFNRTLNKSVILNKNVMRFFNEILKFFTSLWGYTNFMFTSFVGDFLSVGMRGRLNGLPIGFLKLLFDCIFCLLFLVILVNSFLWLVKDFKALFAIWFVDDNSFVAGDTDWLNDFVDSWLACWLWILYECWVLIGGRLW